MSTAGEALELREVRPPTAFAGDRERFLDLLWLVSVAEFKSQYASTFLGFLWTIVRPLIFFGLIFLVLREVLGIGANIEGYGQSLVISLILFTFFADSTNRSVRSLSSKESMIRKMRFPRIIIPLSINLTAGFTLALNFLAVAPLLYAFGLEPRPSWALFGLVIVLLVMLTMAVSTALSVLFVRVRDTAQAWSLISRLLFYGSPILYTLEFVPATFAKVIAVNPLTLLFAQSRVWLVDPDATTPVESAGVWLGLVAPLAVIAATCVIAVRVFKQDAPRVGEEL